MTMPVPVSEHDPVIRIENLTTHYGRTEILHDINLVIRQGEIMVILGGSGSGKSTLLRYMLGLETPTQGHIDMLGQNITRTSVDDLQSLRRNIGVAFQNGALLSSLTVLDNVMLPLQENTDLDETIIRIMARMKLELVHLGDYERLMPAELSGGMIKRAALARAIVTDPGLLFFDEPSAGLDPVVSAEIDELMLQLRDVMGMTIVVVTHELESAFRIADRITVLDQGRILITDTAEAVRVCGNERVQSLLNRKPPAYHAASETYLDRLTAD